MLEWYWIVLIVAVALIVIVLIFANKKFRGFVLEAVCKAEEEIQGTKKGQERFAQVVSQIRAIIPTKLQWLFTEARIKKIIEWAVKKMKQALGNP
jgi:hypothetical protein